MANTIVISTVGALINLSDVNLIEKALNSKKEELNLKGEIKWTKVTDNYLDKYIEMINLFFELIKDGNNKSKNYVCTKCFCFKIFINNIL